MTTIAGVKMADLKRTKESLAPGNTGKLSPSPYSSDHRIALDQDALTKMGVQETPKVGDVFHVMGEGHVHSVNVDPSGGNLQVGMQMKQLGVKKKQGSGAMAAVNKGISDASE